MTFQLPSHADQAVQLADGIANQFESAFRNRLTDRLNAFFSGGCAEAFAEIAVEKMQPAMKQLAALPASPAPSSRHHLVSPTRGVGFGARKSLGTASSSIDVEVASDGDSDS